MRVKLFFSNGQSVELPCTVEDFKPLLSSRIAHEQPEITGYTLVVECLYCNESFETKNPVAKYESASHRKLASYYKLPSVKQRPNSKR